MFAGSLSRFLFNPRPHRSHERFRRKLAGGGVESARIQETKIATTIEMRIQAADLCFAQRAAVQKTNVCSGMKISNIPD